MSADKPNRKRRKPRKPAKRKNTRVTGERSEAAFLSKAANLGFGVAKPWGDSCRYDFIAAHVAPSTHCLRIYTRGIYY